MPIRRNLSASLPPQSPQTIAKARVLEEGMYPLQYTPEPAQKPAPFLLMGSSSNMDPNMTFEILDNDDQTANNATIIISGEESKSTDISGPSHVLRPPRPNEGNSVPTKRWENIHVLTFSFDIQMFGSVHTYLGVKCKSHIVLASFQISLWLSVLLLYTLHMVPDISLSSKLATRYSLFFYWTYAFNHETREHQTLSDVTHMPLYFSVFHVLLILFSVLHSPRCLFLSCKIDLIKYYKSLVKLTIDPSVAK